MAKLDTLIAIGEGDILLIGRSYFHAVVVREPTHPAAGGVVLEGWHYSYETGLWRGRADGSMNIVHLHESSPSVEILSAEVREGLGWGDL